MRLPSQFREAIDQECERVERSRLARAAEQITSDYKAGLFGRSLGSPELRAAYLLTRVPATFAANEYVFGELRRLVPEFAPQSVLDLGAGPGTASWAASAAFHSVNQITLLEANKDMAEVGRRLSASLDQVLQRARIVNGDMRALTLERADLVIASYAVGELDDAVAAVSRAWDLTRGVLVIIEPGTPKNFERIAQIRRELIAVDAHVVAPCPHEKECPMYTAADWCHFAVRLERTSEHRRLKGGVLGYEDEKFSYLIFSRQPYPRAETRIVRHPLTHPGHIKLSLCTDGGLVNTTVTKSNKESFRAARRARWGDEWSQFE